MTEQEELEEFGRNLQQDVIANADADEEGALRSEAFTTLVIGYLSDVGEIDDGLSCPFEARGMRCSGYYLSEDNDRLDLFLTIPNLDGEARTTPKTEIDVGFKRLLSFLERALEGIHEGREEALDGYDMARSIWQSRNDLSHVRLFVITDGLARIERIDNKNLSGIEVSSHLWDLRRLYRAVSSGASDETITVDFSKMSGGPLRCIMAQPQDAGYRCLLTTMRADALVEMYKDFGPKLLERNVRSFLQLRGKVNQSIRRTILEEPQMFLAFNNGLSVTAAGLEVRDHGDGTAELISADDFQIVNGGQTTGSIFRASRKDSADVSDILVPVKITEILPEGNVEEIAPQISQSANNQNKVNMADFSSNHPFHRRMEELSRSIWAPPAPGLQRQSRWFYERARGQYHDALAQNRTPAQRKAFEAIHPRKQMITKTDLAKFEHTWSQLPHIVSRGAQKCYLDFMDVVDKRGNYLPDELFFKLLVSRAIMFRETERIVSRRKFGGYRANIVTYTLAWISNSTSKRIDLETIWNLQGLSPALSSFIDVVCGYAHEHITSPPGGQNVTEWCKKEACWTSFRDNEIDIPAALDNELLTRDKASTNSKKHNLEEQTTSEETELIERIAAISADTWFTLSAWAKDTQSLQPWQRSLSFSLGKLAGKNKPPSRKQALHGETILAEARKLGFRG